MANILLIYITNSGGTYESAKRIRKNLEAGGHQVTIKKTVDVNPSEVNQYDVVILGSPSWDFTTAEGQRLEGQPHETMQQLLAQLQKDSSLAGRKFAIYGLGDSSYTHLCGAVDQMEQFVKNISAHQIIDSLRIDSYYFDLDNNNAKVEDWATRLAPLCN